MTYLIIGILVAVSLFFIVQYFRRKKSSWTGTIIDKGFTESVQRNASRRPGSSLTIGGVTLGQNAQSHVSRNYYIKVQTTEGKEIRWPISEGLYETFKVGDKVNKPGGTMVPRVVNE